MAVEPLGAIPVSDIFHPPLVDDPEIREVVEWFISGNHGGKDGNGSPAVTYDIKQDTLVPANNFRERAAHWRWVEGFVGPNHQLSSMPDEDTFRAYLAHRGVFHRDLGVILRSDDHSYLEMRR